MRLTEPNALAVREIVTNLRLADWRCVFGLRRDDDEEALIEEALKLDGYKFLAWHNDEPVAMFGGELQRPGVFLAFCLATERFQSAALGVTKFARRTLLPAAKKNGAHRVEALVVSENFYARRWLRILGAEEEAVLAKYGRSGEEYRLYRWLL